MTNSTIPLDIPLEDLQMIMESVLADYSDASKELFQELVVKNEVDIFEALGKTVMNEQIVIILSEAVKEQK